MSAGYQLERAAAAPLQASGWFVLRGMKDPSFQAFELDAIAYRFGGGDEESLVVEAKAGKSAFGDLWKLVGLKTHLGLGTGVLLADPTDPLFYLKERYAAEHNIFVIDQDEADLAANLADVGLALDSIAQPILSAWEYCFRVEDGLIATITDKTLRARYTTIELAWEQLRHLITKGWMEPDPWRQAVRLYTLFSHEPKIAQRMAVEINNGGWRELFRRAMYDGVSGEIQACFYLEHRKRIAVAFAATRCAVINDNSSRWAKLAPSSFREMVTKVAAERAWYLPTVLQVYFLGFGGMICTDVTDEEYKHIAQQAGCSAKQAKHALELFAELFPYEGGWYYDGYDLSRLKLMPVPLRGASTRVREYLYNGAWPKIATASQFQVVGKLQIDRANSTEKLARV